MQALDIAVLRGQFPALNQLVDGKTPIFFDGPGGAQVPRPVLTAMTDYLGHFNANLGGPFFSARATEQQAQRARQAVATLLGADRAEEIVFGANFTTLTFAVSRALSREWQAGDEIIVSGLEHHANLVPWQQLARIRGAQDPHAPIRHALRKTSVEGHELMVKLGRVLVDRGDAPDHAGGPLLQRQVPRKSGDGSNLFTKTSYPQRHGSYSLLRFTIKHGNFRANEAKSQRFTNFTRFWCSWSAG